MKALLSGHESTVRILLERGSDIRGPHIEAGGLVSCAVETGQLAMLKLLVEFGADMNIPYASNMNKGVYPLWRAVCSKSLSTNIVRFLQTMAQRLRLSMKARSELWSR